MQCIDETHTNVLLLQPRQSRERRPITLIIIHISIAAVINAPVTKQLYRRRNDARQEQHKQDERANDHDTRLEPALGVEHKLNKDEYQQEGANGDTVGEEPVIIVINFIIIIQWDINRPEDI